MFVWYHSYKVQTFNIKFVLTKRGYVQTIEYHLRLAKNDYPKNCEGYVLRTLPECDFSSIIFDI